MSERIWIDRLGVRMEEPRDRYVFGPQQVMTSVEYTGPYQEELLAFRAAVEDFFNYAKGCRDAHTQGLPMPAAGENLLYFLSAYVEAKDNEFYAEEPTEWEPEE